MSSGTQIDLGWPGADTSASNQGHTGQAHLPAKAEGALPAASAPSDPRSDQLAYLTDEEILGITPIGAERENANSVTDETKAPGEARDAASRPSSEPSVAGEMPPWMQAIAADPKNGEEARQLWQEHQEFCAAFSTPAEARSIREMFPGGAQEARTLKQASQSVDRIDAAIFSGDTRAQSEVVAELARANPAALRAMFVEAGKVLGMGPAVGNDGAVAGTQNTWNAAAGNGPRFEGQAAPRGVSGQAAQVAPEGTAQAAPAAPFDASAYASFERSTNDAVARDVRSNIHDTLSRVLPEGVAEGAARRIGDDIFHEVHRALAADRTLSEQVGEALRGPLASGQGWRFGNAEQQRVASLLAGRAKQLVPSVARRVIGEWTSTVLGTARSKAARQAAAASRVDIAATGGSLDSMPLRAMSSREVDYASMSDDQILGM